MAVDLNLEKLLAGLSAEARVRVENALKEALEKEGAFQRAAQFDRGPFDRSGFDRSSKAQLGEVEQVDPASAFIEKDLPPAR